MRRSSGYGASPRREYERGFYHPPQVGDAYAGEKGLHLRSIVPVPQTDTGGLAEYAKVDE